MPQSLRERPVSTRLRPVLPPSPLDRLLLLLRWLLFASSVGLVGFMLLHGVWSRALPVAALALLVNPFVELPPLAWFFLTAFVVLAA